MPATLLSAIVKGDKKHLLKQLQANKNFNLNTKIKYSPSKEVEEYDALPLCIATIHANKDIVHILLDHGARADVRDGIDRSPVICAIYGCIDSLKITSENYSLVTKKSPAHEAILAILIRSLPGSSFQDIVNSPQNGSFLKGITPLCLSAYLGKVGICKCLLENGAAVDGVDKNGASPLMYAARDGHVDVVKTLLAFGASIELKDLNGWTASQYGQGYPEVLEILEAETLKKNGVTSIFPKNILKNVSSAYPNFYKDFTSFLGNYKLSQKDQDQNTIATLGVSLERTDTLGGAGIEDLNQNLASNQHKLLLAIKYSDVQSVSEYAGGVNFIDEASGLSPLQYATRIRPLVSPSSKKIVKLLVEAGADVNACNIRSGKTPLHYITRDPFNIEATKQEPTPAEKESTQSLIMSIIACLVNSNADPNKADFDGNRPLHYACKSNQQPIVEYLITKADANPLLANKRGKTPIDVCPSDGYLKSFIEFQTRSSNVAILGNLFSEKPRYSRGFDSAYHSSENISRLANSSAINENNVKESSDLDNKPLPPTVTTTSQETVRYIEELGAIEDEAANLMSILSNNPGTSTDMDEFIAERLNIMQDDVRNAEATSELLLEDNSKLLRENLELKEKEDEYLSEIERLTKLQAVFEENKLTTVETPSSSTTKETHEETGEQGVLTAEIFKAYTKMAESLEQRELEKESLISSLNAERSKRMSAEAELTVSKEVITFLESEVKLLKDNGSNNHRDSINSVSTKYLSMIDGIEGIDRRHSVMPQSSSVPSNPQHPRHSMLNVFDAAGAKQPSAEEMQRAFENLEDDSGFVLLEDLLTQYNPRMSVGDMSRLRQSINLGTSRLDKRNSILSLIDTSAGDVSGEDGGLNVEVLHRLLNAVKSRIYHLNTILTSMKITNNSLEHDLSKTRSELAETNTALDASNSKSERVDADNLQLRADLYEMTKQLESLQGLYDDGCTERKEELESVFKLLQVFIGTPESEIVKTDNLSISSKTAPAPVNTSVQGNGFLHATVKTLEQFDEALLLKHGGSAYKGIKSLLQELSPSLNKKLPRDLPINEIHTTHANYITNIIKSVDAITGNFSVIEKVLASMKEENRKYVKEIIRMRNSALLKGFVNEVRKADKVAASSTTGNEFPSGSNNNHRLSRKMSMPLISRNGLDSTFVKEEVVESDPPAKPEISTDTMTVKQLLESLQSFQTNNQTITKDIGIEQQSKEHLQALLKTMTDQGLCVDEVKEEFNGTEVQKKRLGIILPDISKDGSDATAPIVAKKELFKTPWEKVASTFSTMNSNKSNTSSSESAVSTGTRKSSNSSREGSPKLGALFGKIKDAKSKTAMRVKDLKAVFEGKNV